MKSDRFLECGKIVNTHGVKGGMRAESWCDKPSVLTGLSHLFTKTADGFAEHAVTHASQQKDMVLLTFADVTDMDMAEKLKNTVLYALREDIPLVAGSYFRADLIGLSVFDNETGALLGTVQDIVNRGASDLYEVKTPRDVRYLPAVKEFIVRVDLETGIFIHRIPGLFDDDFENLDDKAEDV